MEPYIKHREFWDTSAHAMYERWRLQDTWMKTIVVPKIELLEGGIIDLGCGQGILYDLLSEECRDKYCGFDYSIKMLDEFKSRHNKALVINGDIINTNIESKQYDNSVCINTLMYFDESEKKVLNEISRITKKTAIIVAPLGLERSTDGVRVVFKHDSFIENTRDMFNPKTIIETNLNDHDYWLIEVSM